MNAAKKFMSKGDKVKITLRFRGREMAHMNASKHILDDIAENLYLISFCKEFLCSIHLGIQVVSLNVR